MAETALFEPGGYRYVRGPFQYSGGVTAAAGLVIERASFARPLPIAEGFAAHDRALQAIRHLVRDRRRVATTIGYGPRFLHSTGQLHKGGPTNALFLQVTADHESDVPVPGAPYTFGVLADAQALGDLRVLRGLGRPVARVHLGDAADLSERLGEMARGA